MKLSDKPIEFVKVKGDAGEYEVWGIDWLYHKILIMRAGANEWVPFKKLKQIPNEK